MDNFDIEKLNRDNFKALMNTLSMPGEKESVSALFDSSFLALANVLLYSQASFFYNGKDDFELVCALTNTYQEKIENADYIFSDKIDENLLKEAKIGTSLEPEFSATIIFKCKDFKGLKVRLRGAGIDGYKDITLPVDEAFVNTFNEKNSNYPLGNELFFLSDESKVLALSRTTKVEVL